MKKLVILLGLMLVSFSGPARAADAAMAVFAGGCFWCMEAEFSHKQGVNEVISGYASSSEGEQPTYEQVSTGTTDFKEAISVVYDPALVTYQQLLDIFWSNVDPFDEAGQFCDKGKQYQAAIFYGSPTEKTLAEESLKKVEAKFGRTVATQIQPQITFYPAEDHHQDYFETNADRYKVYKAGCGRAETLQKIWGDAPAPLMAPAPVAPAAPAAVAPAQLTPEPPAQ